MNGRIEDDVRVREMESTGGRSEDRSHPRIHTLVGSALKKNLYTYLFSINLHLDSPCVPNHALRLNLEARITCWRSPRGEKICPVELPGAANLKIPGLQVTKSWHAVE